MKQWTLVQPDCSHRRQLCPSRLAVAALALSVVACWMRPQAVTAGEHKYAVLLAGAKSHPVGQHEYGRTLKLIKYLLENSPNAPKFSAEVHFDGWPADPAVLEKADVIVTMTDSGDYPVTDQPSSFYTRDRIAIIERAMNRGAGLVTLHSATFTPSQYATRMRSWTGGYFDWQTGDGKGGFYGFPVDAHTQAWHSIIRSGAPDLAITAPAHEVSNGLIPFSVKDEFYFRLRFADRGVTPILSIPQYSDNEAERTVAWAFERSSAGRGFGFTPGHSYANWRDANFRKVVLNGIVWASGATVPLGGVESSFESEEEVNRAQLVRPITTLLVGGGTDAAHFEAAQVPGISAALNSETPRFAVTSSSSIAPLAGKLSKFRLVVLTRCSELSGRDVNTLREYVRADGRLMILYSPESTPAHIPPPVRTPPALTDFCELVKWGRTTDSSSVSGDGWSKVLIDMRIADHAHPAMRGLADRAVAKWETDFPIEFDLARSNKLHVLAWNRSPDTGTESPMAFVTPFVRGRVFHLVTEAMQQIDLSDGQTPRLSMSNLSPVTVALLRRGALWSAGEPASAIYDPNPRSTIR